MALYDPSEQIQRAEAKHAYELLKEDLRTTKDFKVHERYQALHHMYNMEMKIKKLEEEAQKHREFFDLLNSLL